jgi:hypothetical protein
LVLLRQGRQFLRFGHIAVDDHQLGRLLGQQRQQGPACGTPRAQNQHTPALQRTAQVVHHIAHQAHAIKVLHIHPVALELHGIHGTGHLRAGGQVGGVGKSVEFERRCHVHASPTGRPKRVHRGRKLAQGAQQLAVVNVLPRHLRKSAVDQG